MSTRLVILACLLFPVLLYAQEDLGSVEASFYKGLKKLSSDYTQRGRILDDKFLASLKNMEQGYIRDGNLEAVLAVKKMREHLEEKGSVSTDKPQTQLAPLRRLWVSYFNEFNKIETEKATKISALISKVQTTLEREERRLTVKGEIDQALDCRKLREKFKIRPLGSVSRSAPHGRAELLVRSF